MEKSLILLHFNDVYEVLENDKLKIPGGVARFKTFVDSFQQQNPLLFFSGDALSPSECLLHKAVHELSHHFTVSTVTKGAHMITALNELNISAACYGNHDFDHGIPNLIKQARQSNFPWLISNAFDALSGEVRTVLPA